MVQFPVSIVDLPKTGVLTDDPSPCPQMDSAACPQMRHRPAGNVQLPPGAETSQVGESPDPRLTLPAPVSLLGLPIVPWRHYEVIHVIDWLVGRGEPSYFVTANLHYARLSATIPALKAVNDHAAFIVADGMPLVWLSRWRRKPLPERITGADLIWSMCELAANRGYRVFLLGGAPGVAETAGQRLQARLRGLQIAGIAAPSLDTLTPLDQSRLITQIRQARTDILFAAFGQPKGELWLAEHIQELGVPVAVQIGAALDFVAGRVRRAPRFVQRMGLEWAYRTLQEPRRLLPRYLADGWFFLCQLMRSSPRS